MSDFPITSRLREIASDLQANARSEQVSHDTVEDAAEKLRAIVLELEQPSAGTDAYTMLAAAEEANVNTTLTLVHMIAATVVSKSLGEGIERGPFWFPATGEYAVAFGPADVDEMHRNFEMHAVRDGLLTIVSIKKREQPLPSLRLDAEPGIDDAPAKAQAEPKTHDRPLWAVRQDGKLWACSSREIAEARVRRAAEETHDMVAEVENRFCYHDECPADRCNRTESMEVASEE